MQLHAATNAASGRSEDPVHLLATASAMDRSEHTKAQLDDVPATDGTDDGGRYLEDNVAFAMAMLESQRTSTRIGGGYCYDPTVTWQPAGYSRGTAAPGLADRATSKARSA